MSYWLIKTEGACYSIDDLKKDKKTSWDGIRNYQARNFMMRDMKAGDLVLFYHSNSNPSGVYGVAKVASGPRSNRRIARPDLVISHPDPTQFDKKDMHYDPKATKEKPIWYSVDMAFVKKFKNIVSLGEIKIDPKLEGMMVRAPGSRLSIQPVSQKHFEHIRKLGK